MNPLYYFALITVLLGALAFWYLYQRRAFALFATLGFFAVSILNFTGGFEIMGTAKPKYLEWRNIGGGRIVGLYWIENVAIYLTILVDGKPVLYELPWMIKNAEKLELQRRKLREGDGEELYYSEDGGDADKIIENQETQLPPKTNHE